MGNKKQNEEFVRALAYSIVLASFSDAALAGPLDGFGTTFLNILNNNFLRAVATAAVIIMFFAGLARKLSWSWFLTISLSIAGMFSAAAIVSYFQGVAIG
jgi:type IV secretory pathway VirB2 component (pilin)